MDQAVAKRRRSTSQRRGRTAQRRGCISYSCYRASIYVVIAYGNSPRSAIRTYKYQDIYNDCVVCGWLTELTRRKLSPCRVRNGPRPDSEQKRYRCCIQSYDATSLQVRVKRADARTVSMQGKTPLSLMPPKTEGRLRHTTPCVKKNKSEAHVKNCIDFMCQQKITICGKS